jgi:hypothetical protein
MMIVKQLILLEIDVGVILNGSASSSMAIHCGFALGRGDNQNSR